MSLSHAILAALLGVSRTGYELSKRFDRSIGYFWHATHQQIYRELMRMEAEKVVSVEVSQQDAALPRKVYTYKARRTGSPCPLDHRTKPSITVT